MNEETIYPLDAEALALFARKGREGGAHVPQAGEANGVKVRRVMQMTRDLSRKPFAGLRILDLGCGEGVYAIEAALRGAQVLALDARDQRMKEGAACAERHGLGNLRFVCKDVREVTEALGSYDVVYLLGLLYHLDAPDIFTVLENIAKLCTRLLIIDTLVALEPDTAVEWRGRTFAGTRHREHEDGDSAQLRKSRVLKSIDNTFSLRLSRESLLRALHEAGFTSCYECRLPFEPGKAGDRITLAAVKDMPVKISTYPWVNGKSEAEIELALAGGAPTQTSGKHGKGEK